MFSKLFKKSVTHDQLAKWIAEELAPHALKAYADPEQIGIVRESPKRSQAELKREWIAFTMFMLYRGAAAALPTSYDLRTFFESASDYCGKAFVMQRVFESTDEYAELAAARFEVYDRAVQDERPPNPVYWVGKAYGENCGADITPSELYAWSACFVQFGTLYKDVIVGLLRLCK